MEAEATKTLHTVVRGLPSGRGPDGLYEQEPVVNRKVATTVHIAGIPNRTDHGFIYGSAILPVSARRITAKLPTQFHSFFLSPVWFSFC